jgi:hypothetical protein
MGTPGIPSPEPLPPPSGSSLSDSNFQNTIMINRVFDTLVNLIGVLQSVAIAQAQNLNVLTQWQQAYTNLMAKVPVFTSTSDVFGGTGTAEANIRDDVNRVNSSFLEQLRSSNQIVGNYAKSMNSSISQTNDNVSQFGNMATAFLQELSTILATIYR